MARAVAEKKKAKEGKGGKVKGAGKGAKGANKGATTPPASNLTLGNPICINGEKSKLQKAEASRLTASIATAPKAVTRNLAPLNTNATSLQLQEGSARPYTLAPNIPGRLSRHETHRYR